MGTMMLHSIGGGTGSGLGSRLMEVKLLNFRKSMIIILVDIFIIQLFFQIIKEKILYSIIIQYYQ